VREAWQALCATPWRHDLGVALPDVVPLTGDEIEVLEMNRAWRDGRDSLLDDILLYAVRVWDVVLVASLLQLHRLLHGLPYFEGAARGMLRRAGGPCLPMLAACHSYLVYPRVPLDAWADRQDAPLDPHLADASLPAGPRRRRPPHRRRGSRSSTSSRAPAGGAPGASSVRSSAHLRAR